MPLYTLTHFEIQRYYLNKPSFTGVYWKNNLPKIKNGAYAVKLNYYKSIGTNQIAFYVNGKNVTYLDSFEMEHISKNNKKNYRK